MITVNGFLYIYINSGFIFALVSTLMGRYDFDYLFDVKPKEIMGRELTNKEEIIMMIVMVLTMIFAWPVSVCYDIYRKFCK